MAISREEQLKILGMMQDADIDYASGTDKIARSGDRLIA
jgi:hypothetical protein